MAAPSVFDRLGTLSDPTRSRLLHVLDRHELTVSELCAVVQLPQSTVSRHLKILADEGWVTSRAEGTSRLYTIAGPLDPGARRLWQVVREEVSGGATAAHDAERVRAVLAERRTRAQEFFSTAAGQWDALRGELFGERADLHALLALLDDGWTVGDLGCGTGRLSSALAPFVGRVIAVDSSRAMLAAARKRLADASNVELRAGDLESLPVKDGELDAAVLALVLHYAGDPAAVLAEARRALKPGGRLLVIDTMPHEREEYRRQMGHVWLGFSEPQMTALLADAGLERVRYVPLPIDPGVKGPQLFVVTGSREGRAARGEKTSPALQASHATSISSRTESTKRASARPSPLAPRDSVRSHKE